MKFSTLTLQRNDAIARLTLNRPGALNAINGAMLDEIRAALPGSPTTIRFGSSSLIPPASAPSAPGLTWPT